MTERDLDVRLHRLAVACGALALSSVGDGDTAYVRTRAAQAAHFARLAMDGPRVLSPHQALEADGIIRILEAAASVLVADFEAPEQQSN